MNFYTKFGDFGKIWRFWLVCENLVKFRGFGKLGDFGKIWKFWQNFLKNARKTPKLTENFNFIKEPLNLALPRTLNISLNQVLTNNLNNPESDS